MLVDPQLKTDGEGIVLIHACRIRQIPLCRHDLISIPRRHMIAIPARILGAPLPILSIATNEFDILRGEEGMGHGWVDAASGPGL